MQLNQYIEKNKNKKIKDRYIFLDEIGNKKKEKGTFSRVFKVKDIKTNEIKAIKMINKTELKQNIKEIYTNDENAQDMEFHKWINDFYDEVSIMEYFNENENSIKYYDIFHDKDDFCFITEFYDDDLISFMNKKKKLNKIEIFKIVFQLNNIFKAMQEKGKEIIHRNIKPQNILIKYQNWKNSEYCVKLAGYKASDRFYALKKQNKNNNNNNKEINLTMAPEIIKGENFSSKSDLWSLGIIIYFLVFNQYPYLGNEAEILDQINLNEKNIIKNTEDDDLNNLIVSLLEKDPEKRLDWEHYFNHAFFTKFDLNQNSKNCSLI